MMTSSRAEEIFVEMEMFLMVADEVTRTVGTGAVAVVESCEDRSL